MKLLYSFATHVGTFFVGQTDDGRFHAIFGDESLGSYFRAEQAIEALADGETYSATGVADTSVLRISADLKEWTRLSGCSTA